MDPLRCASPATEDTRTLWRRFWIENLRLTKLARRD
ncbi:hypothetical protein DUNSADRAFT_7557 [Dunaliella salina]|uniref:Uncharacterized protein n=1 Tax=Dunaliella salina TaxID=3046 RepID=A0ABQ7GL46_DUNSA|nr:hypothetical protein DUNSADRAFT_7557 [Dunaliella salina]|eukprot:KAF5835325.1 hypothetical protein DUNSADRAFT_7557 [Dunaliella salina]